MDGDAARRAKVLREALRSMNKGVPSTDAQVQQQSPFALRREQRKLKKPSKAYGSDINLHDRKHDLQKQAIGTRLKLHEPHKNDVGRRSRFASSDDGHGAEQFLSRRFAAPVRPKLVFGRRLSPEVDEGEGTTAKVQVPSADDEERAVASALRKEAVYTEGGIVDVDKLMGIQQIRAKNKGAAENGNSAENKTIRPLKAGSSTNFTSDGATKQAAIMHHS